MNYWDLDTLKYEPNLVKAGDKININGQEFFVSEVDYEIGVDYAGRMKFKLDKALRWPPLENEVYIPHDNQLRVETLWPNPFIRQQQEEEISDETREEFMRLLK